MNTVSLRSAPVQKVRNYFSRSVELCVMTTFGMDNTEKSYFRNALPGYVEPCISDLLL